MNFDRFDSLPNMITLGRLLLAPLIVATIVAGQWPAAFLVFVIAGLSDALDGWLAKRFDLRSELGAFLDPLADKALLMAIYIALALSGALSPTLAILVVSRDIMILGGVMTAWLLNKPVTIAPLQISKINTAGQIALAATILAAKAFAWPTDYWLGAFSAVVAALTVASAGAYLVLWTRHMSQ